ncbi:glycosyltransferase family protein [Planctomicrobium piriforme]|uniref:Dolichyl-phosphate-mannose-protein mannosyltransferase n=1 Tax=Planctomicrobium piriforme TaxID=1576369 RepID=A0A1I3LWF8_9PLAN|nr:hypothetical protein [Planctomicrobium piriforme]SFI89101.1 Dolichyl-phosphate-mannose-protein mannosyltransferase [Planctomicrobium piriforme]
MTGSAAAKGAGVVLVLLALAAGVLQTAVLWWSDFPLGVPGEWVWERIPVVGSLLVIFWPALAAGVLLTGYVVLGSGMVAQARPWSRTAWLVGLWLIGSVWLLSVVGSTPGISGLSRIPFVLFYPRSSGYFTQAKEHAHDIRGFLKGYRERIADSDNPENHLHLGTHPPGLTLSFLGMIRACESSPGLTEFILATQPAGVSEGNDAVRRTEQIGGKGPAFLPADAAVLWLGGWIAAVISTGTCIPLYLLARRFVTPSAAWWTAGLWLLVPAAAVFLPKSDVLFPCLAMWAQWFWLTALDRNRFWHGAATGAVMCVACTLSLAFVPVALMLFLQGLVLRPESTGIELLSNRSRWHVYAGGTSALGAWLLLCGVVGGFNLIGIWIQNLKNHAAFYAHHVRSYWPWLLDNPIELAFSLGLPLALLAVIGLSLVGRIPGAKRWELLIPAAVWMLLWISGKNMGEAARLWVFLMPYAVWSAASAVQFLQQRRNGQAAVAALWLVQMIVCAATAVRIDGFGFNELGP